MLCYNELHKEKIMKTRYSHMSFNRRMARILGDVDFKHHCERLRERADFDEVFAIAEKVAKIDVSQIGNNKSLISGLPKKREEDILFETEAFYSYLDSFAPGGINFVEQFNRNKQYFITDPAHIKNLRGQAPDKVRSFCSNEILPDGTERKQIFSRIEGRIGDTPTAIHEFGHSFCETFMQCISPKDRDAGEYPAVILDQISSHVLRQLNMNEAEAYLEYDKFTQILNVKKARECLAEALIVKVMIGEITFDQAMSTYGNLFKEFPDIMLGCVEKIEACKFNDIMFEGKYLVPQAIALDMRERFRQDQRVVVELLKEIIAHNHEWTEEETLTHLGFISKHDVIDDYVEKYPTRIAQIDDAIRAIQQHNLQTNFTR